MYNMYFKHIITLNVHFVCSTKNKTQKQHHDESMDVFKCVQIHAFMNINYKESNTIKPFTPTDLYGMF